MKTTKLVRTDEKKFVEYKLGKHIFIHSNNLDPDSWYLTIRPLFIINESLCSKEYTEGNIINKIRDLLDIRRAEFNQVSSPFLVKIQGYLNDAIKSMADKKETIALLRKMKDGEETSEEEKHFLYHDVKALYIQLELLGSCVSSLIK